VVVEEITLWRSTRSGRDQLRHNSTNPKSEVAFRFPWQDCPDWPALLVAGTTPPSPDMHNCIWLRKENPEPSIGPGNMKALSRMRWQLSPDAEKILRAVDGIMERALLTVDASEIGVATMLALAIPSPHKRNWARNSTQQKRCACRDHLEQQTSINNGIVDRHEAAESANRARLPSVQRLA
jgi:hypothetical protein